MRSLRFKPVLRLDEIQRHFRLFRLMWERGVVGHGNGGYSTKLAVGLTPRLFGWHSDGGSDWRLTILGVRIHYCRSYGGIFA